MTANAQRAQHGARVLHFPPPRPAVAQSEESVENELREFINHVQRLALLRPAAAAFVLRWATVWVRDWVALT